MDQNNTVNCIYTVHNRIKPDFKSQSMQLIHGWSLMSVVPPLSVRLKVIK